ncbi:MAG: hypothetical protein H6Q54_953 [Deltaproteobacteria bacterium]|jgi:hypothetical protein|nr:hypothetical protein [Deltaproteobacteria bacterium]
MEYNKPRKGAAMKLPEYITKKEVQRVCKELKIRDWAKLKKASVLPEEAKTILSLVNVENMKIDLKEFAAGLEVELEHGVRFKDANVTNNHPVITGMIVLAHLKESLDYYKLLDVAEAEGDLLKAVAAGDVAKIKKYYKKVAQTRIVLSQAAASQVK